VSTTPAATTERRAAPEAAAGELGRQRWARVLPIVFVTYSLAYLDRTNYSVGIAGGMKEDLAITGSIASLIGAAFFLGYFLLQIPGAVYAERRSVKTLIFWSLIAWGVLASVQGLLDSAGALIAVRFMLGIVEAAVLPAMVVFLSHWFTSRERGRANTILILGNPITVLWLTAISGYVIEAVSWRGMFIIEGLPALAWAFVFRALVTDHPRDAKWLARGEKDGVTRELEAEQRALPPARSHWEALRSPAVVLLSLQYFLWSVGVYGFVFWLPSIVKAGSGAGIGDTGLISAAPYALAALLMYLNSRGSDRAARRAVFVWPWLAIAAALFYGSYLLGPDRFWASYVLLFLAGAAMYAPYGPFFAWISEFLPRDVAAPAVGLINSFGALGAFAGSYFVGWMDDLTGGTGASFLLLAGSLAAAAVVTIVVRTHTRHSAGRVGTGRFARPAAG
jgi:sugar phosphate permease